MIWKIRGREYDLSQRGWIMGVLNVTPDSFSDGGRFFSPEAAISQGLQMATDGATILDIGGESSRPGAAPVTPGEEQRRVLPVVERLVPLGVPVSVDTMHAEDVRGLPLHEMLARYEVLLIEDAYRRNGGSLTKTAAELQVSKQNLAYKMKKYNIR